MTKAGGNFGDMINDLSEGWKISTRVYWWHKKTVQNHPDFVRFFFERSGFLARKSCANTAHGVIFITTVCISPLLAIPTDFPILQV